MKMTAQRFGELGTLAVGIAVLLAMVGGGWWEWSQGRADRAAEAARVARQTTTCPACGKRVSLRARTCPHCGETEPGK